MAFATSPPKNYFPGLTDFEIEYPDWMPPIEKMLVIKSREL